MSIYSGFATRKDQTNYNNLLQKLLKLMQQHLFSLLKTCELTPHFVNNYHKIITKMQHYQEHKYLPPKFSQAIVPLAKVMGIHVKIDHSSIDINQQSFEEEEKASSVKLNFTQKSAKKDRLYTQPRLKSSQACFQNKTKRNSKRPDTGIYVIKNVSELLGIEKESKQKDSKTKQQFYEKHQKKLKKMDQRYNRKLHNFLFKRDGCKNFERSNFGTPANLNRTFKSSKFGSEWLSTSKTGIRSERNEQFHNESCMKFQYCKQEEENVR